MAHITCMSEDNPFADLDDDEEELESNKIVVEDDEEMN